jgi:hypothetical protein
MSIEIVITKLCRFAYRYNKSKTAFKSSSGEGAFVVQLLDEFARHLISQTKIKQYSNLQITISKGQSNLPKIFWVGIVPSSRTVSTSVSVTICFGRNGEGVVAGLMLPSAGTLHNLETVKRVPTSISVNVDGDKAGSQYNQLFINPKEFLVAEIKVEELIEHLNQSMQTLLEITSTGANGYSLIMPSGRV